MVKNIEKMTAYDVLSIKDIEKMTDYTGMPMHEIPMSERHRYSQHVFGRDDHCQFCGVYRKRAMLYASECRSKIPITCKRFLENVWGGFKAIVMVYFLLFFMVMCGAAQNGNDHITEQVVYYFLWGPLWE